MKKIVALSVLLAIVLTFAVAVPALAIDYVTLEVDGVPTLYLPDDGVPVISETGRSLPPIVEDDIVLVGVHDFDQLENEIYADLLRHTQLPVLFQDKQHTEQDIDVDADSVSLIFDFYLTGESSEVLDEYDGTAANLRFEIEGKVAEENLLIAQYVYGEWVALDPAFYTYKDGILDIMLENEGMLAFFAYRRVEEENPDEGRIADAEEVVYRPSVTFRAYPEPVEAEPGYYYVLEGLYVRFDDPAVKVPASEIKLYSAKDFSEEEKKAYDALAKADPLTLVCKNLGDVLKSAYPDVSADDLVVRDIFGLDMGSTAEEYLLTNTDGCLVLKFKYAIEEGDTFLVLQYCDGAWVALDMDHVSVEDGFVTVKLQRSGLLAFLVE